jgi:hypothetical protein
MPMPQLDYPSVALPAPLFWPENGQCSVAPSAGPEGGGPSASI